MFGIKTKIINNLKKKFTRIENDPFLFIKNIPLLHLAKKELENELKFIDLQKPISSTTNPHASMIFKKFSKYMPNNLGNWSIKKPYTFTGKIELNLINYIKNKYKCDKNIIAYFGSGTTEGNIYAAWLGRNYLNQKFSIPNSKIVMIKNNLAHYSLEKAADLIGITSKETSVDAKQLNLDVKELEKSIVNMVKKGFKGFLLPLTLGYTVSGSDDDYKKISLLIKKLEKENINCKFFIWIDAAFSGISKIYTENFQPFKYKNIQLVSSDFHKFLSIPYPANIILYKKNLLKYIEKPIPYIDQKDTTLLGSRPGINVLATWFTLLNINDKKMTKAIKKSLKTKEQYLKNIKNPKEKIKIINNKNSMQACLIVQNQKAERSLEKNSKLEKIRYQVLIKNRKKTLNLYKLYFFPKFK